MSPSAPPSPTPATAAHGARSPSARAERTRAAILAAAERQFAANGYSATRLEDVAAQVGIRRASIVYYYKDKRELYDAVLAGLMGDLFERTAKALSAEGPLAGRIEQAVGAWVDFVGERPTLARILLREAADATPERRPPLLAHTGPFVEVIERVIADSEGDPASDFPVDALHLASMIAGATVFFVAAMPFFAPQQLGFDPLSAAHLASHRSEVLRITRRLLGNHSDASDDQEISRTV
jgi:TetR/AcrR family transcriptional regulator